MGYVSNQNTSTVFPKQWHRAQRSRSVDSSAYVGRSYWQLSSHRSADDPARTHHHHQYLEWPIANPEKRTSVHQPRLFLQLYLVKQQHDEWKGSGRMLQCPMQAVSTHSAALWSGSSSYANLSALGAAACGNVRQVRPMSANLTWHSSVAPEISFQDRLRRPNTNWRPRIARNRLTNVSCISWEGLALKFERIMQPSQLRRITNFPATNSSLESAGRSYCSAQHQFWLENTVTKAN
jgi:hypothetical protein